MWYKDNSNDNEKILIVCRGCAGSGKSTLAKQLAGKSGQIFSTDDFFMDDNKNYNFDAKQLGVAHNWNFVRASRAIMAGISPIIIDNTNVEAWEPKRYVQFALDHGYHVEIAEPDTPWKFDAEELAKRNQHGVPKEIIEKKLKNWYPDLTVEDILNAKDPFEKK